MSSIKKIFREYDIRGIFEQDLSAKVVASIGASLADELKSLGENALSIGYDARTHSPKLFEWLSYGFKARGVEVYALGLIPTPVAYFATYNEQDCENGAKIKCTNSVMITGSHNPPQYNGFKITIQNAPFYGQQIQNLGDKVEQILRSGEFENLDSENFKTREIQNLNALESYINFLSAHFAHLKNFPYKIAVDCGNGVAGVAIKKILDNLQISYEPLFFAPDGTFPNHHPDPSEEHNLADLKNAMNTAQIPIGIAFDGDADRLALLTKNHNFKGDELAILFAREMASRGIKPLVIGEVKCSGVMYDEIDKIGQSVMYKTGHSNLKVKLKELNAHLAAEMSGHIFFKERYFGFDDAIYSAFRALELFVKSSPQDIEAQIQNLPRVFSTPEEKINTTEEQKFALIAQLSKLLKNPPSDFPKIIKIIDIDGLRVVFEQGWGLLRASNTTPVLVSRFEANSKEQAQVYKTKMLELLEVAKDQL